ncbi:TetR/AcrR family transcriptional regulator [Desulfatiglans anilini]|uniref:TetR/AcrR family transcriptional regulator n=1 Tax=Desulfatiglans anilini TaxID=90728 RepID=UPI00040F6B70|nr:TetR/AcrR family transcriptional regulator [Desulfatiglans anilini]
MVKKRDAILNTAAKLFSEHGFKETSIADIARATGVAEGTIFYHFKSKEDLFLAILQEVKEDILREFNTYRKESEPLSGLQMMEEAISFYLYLAAKMDERFLLLHRHYPYKLAEVNPVCRGYLEDIFNCLLDIFEQAVELGQKDRSIAPMPARKNALIVLTMVDGLVRFRDYNLYDAAALHSELLSAVRRMLRNPSF